MSPPQKQRLLALLALGLFVGMGGWVEGVEPTLRAAAAGRFEIGAAVEPRAFEDPLRRELLLRHFGSLSAENALKPDATQPEEGKFQFERGDRLVGFAEAHGLTVVGHTLVWHSQMPDWMAHGTAGAPLTREQALARMEAHITAVVGRYRGRIAGWDVVNEALSDEAGGYLRDTPWLRAIGPDYIAAAYRFARAADPAAKLFYNDYNLEIPSKREAALRLLRELEAAGVRVDAVGLQAHYTLQWERPPAEDLRATRLWPSIAQIEETILDFHKAGYPVMFTELDMNVLPGRYTGADLAASIADRSDLDPFAAGCPPEVLEAQARAYGEIFALLVRHRDKVRRITFWGLTDADSWLNNWPVRGRTNHPLLFDRAGRPKPAFERVLSALTAPGEARGRPADGAGG